MNKNLKFTEDSEKINPLTSANNISTTDGKSVQVHINEMQTDIDSKLPATSNAVSASKLKTAVTIDGVSFDGSSSIATSYSHAFSIATSAWGGSGTSRTWTYSNSKITADMLAYVAFDKTSLDRITDCVPTTAAGSVTLTTSYVPSGTVSGTIYFFRTVTM